MTCPLSIASGNLTACLGETCPLYMEFADIETNETVGGCKLAKACQELTSIAVGQLELLRVLESISQKLDKLSATTKTTTKRTTKKESKSK